MDKPYRLGLFIFRRDLRLVDNSALHAAFQSCQQVLVAFIFDLRQIKKHAYQSTSGLYFMVNSLQELATTIKQRGGHLYMFCGVPEQVIATLNKQLTIDALFINRDYTPFSKTRDSKMHALCSHLAINFHSYADSLIHEPEAIHKTNGKPYTIYTPFYRYASQIPVTLPYKNTRWHFYTKPIAFTNDEMIAKFNRCPLAQPRWHGGRKEGLAFIKRIATLLHYETIRNIPALEGTSYLSAHLKFGTVSIREVYQAIKTHLGHTHTLIKELFWRDFFCHIAWHFPHVFHSAFNARYQNLPWDNNQIYLQRWCNGQTGFPIIDAGMRQLQQTGYMHNRVRMIVGSFLIKDLLIDWRLGEMFFAKSLIDYDPAINNGNWQWLASTGCDAQPYFRIFNPWLQQKRFDPECLYIKHYIPELKVFSAKEIHSLVDKPITALKNYPRPMINHKLASQKAISIFKNAQNIKI
jgi:deoxyribodipyrimidine photo-lyase